MRCQTITADLPRYVTCGQREIDELHRLHDVATAQRVARIPESGYEPAVTRNVGLPLRDRAIQRPRLSHLQRLLRLSQASGSE